MDSIFSSNTLLSPGAEIVYLLITILLLGFGAKAIPSRRVFFLMVLPLVLTTLSFSVPVLATVAILFNMAVCFALLVDGFLVSDSVTQIELRRSVGDKLSIGKPNTVVISIVNNANVPALGAVSDATPAGFEVIPPESVVRQQRTWWWQLFYAWVDGKKGVLRFDAPFRVEPLSRFQMSYQVVPKDRGEYRFSRTHVKLKSRWGLLWFVRKLGRPERVNVYPDIKRIGELQIKFSRSLSVGELRKKSLGMEGSQFDGLRYYITGDDSRKLDWRASARVDTPVIRQFSQEVDQPIMVLIDGGRKMLSRVAGLQKFDWALNASLALANVALARKDMVGLTVFSNQILAQVPMTSGKHKMPLILEQIYDVKPNQAEPDYERVFLSVSRQLRRRSLVVLFTDLIDPVASRVLERSLRALGGRHLLVVVTMSDLGALDDYINPIPQMEWEVYRQASAMDLVAQRDKGLKDLQRHLGAVVIDSSPERLDEQVIHAYLSMKLKNKL